MSNMTSDNPFHCNIHDDFETYDVNEWNDHCEQTGHLMSGSTVCIDCGTEIEFNDKPFKRITPTGHNLNYRCEGCTDKQIQSLQNDKAQFQNQDSGTNQ